MNRLIDTFGREHTYLRISVTDRCNLRCVYCMPHDGIEWKKKDQLLTYEEIEKVARVFAAMGINKIRITGGEPLVRKELEYLIGRLARIEGIKTIAMTTNGTLLAPKAALLRELGLSALNISLDTFSKQKFEQITRRDDYDAVIAGLESALQVGFDSLKLNVVVISGFNDNEVIDFWTTLSIRT